MLTNRCGSEADIRYVGTGTVLGRDEQKCWIVNTGTDPECIWDWRRQLFSNYPLAGAESGVEREVWKPSL